MKFVCDRCLTKYSIADEKVRGRILKIRCKSCSNIITVKESAPSPISVTVGESDRTVITSGPHPPRPAPPAASRARPEGGRIGPPTPPAPSAAPSDDIQWFLAIDGVQTGPFSRKSLVDKLAGLPRDSDVHIWNDNLDGWKPPKDVPVVARELQARHRSAPHPPPPPPRLRPVPPPPSQSPTHQPHQPPYPQPHPHPSARGLPTPLGSPVVGSGGHHVLHGSSAAPLPGTPSPAEVIDTPAPIRELVQAHRAQNGESKRMSASSMAAVGAPGAAMSNGESDALQALNLGGGWRQPGAPDASAEWATSGSAALSMPAGVRLRQRNLKLLTGFVGIVAVCVIVLFIALKKPPPSASAANPRGPEGASKTGQQDEGRSGNPSGKEGSAGPTGVGTDPRPSENAGETDPAGTTVAQKAESVARILAGKKPPRTNPGRTPAPRGVSATTPSAVTPEQLAAVNRFGDTSTKSLQLRNTSPSSAKVTPAQGDITRVVNNNKGGIKVCYQRALLRDNSLTHGKIDVRVSIGISGRVRNVTIDGPAAFRTLEPCIKDVLSRWVFPASSEEYGTEFSYLFQGNE